MDLNFAFYVSGKASRLNNILTGENKKLLKSTKLVFSDDKSNFYIQDSLKANNIDYYLKDYSSITEKTSKSLYLSNIMLQKFIDYEIDYCFCFGDHLLKGDILIKYKNRIINFHPSILPLNPGRKSIDQAIIKKEFLLGNTAHFINDGVDTGPIIMQNIVSSKKYELFGYEGILKYQIPMLYQIYEWLIAGKIKITNELVEVTDADYESVSFFPAIEKL